MNKEELLKAFIVVSSENEKLQQKIDRTIEELELWNPKIEILKIERDALINILRGEDK